MHHSLLWLWSSNISKYALHNDLLAGGKITSCCLSWKENEELWKQNDKKNSNPVLPLSTLRLLKKREQDIKANLSGSENSDSFQRKCWGPSTPGNMVLLYCQSVCSGRKLRLPFSGSKNPGEVSIVIALVDASQFKWCWGRSPGRHWTGIGKKRSLVCAANKLESCCCHPLSASGPGMSIPCKVRGNLHLTS